MFFSKVIKISKTEKFIKMLNFYILGCLIQSIWKMDNFVQFLIEWTLTNSQEKKEQNNYILSSASSIYVRPTCNEMKKIKQNNMNRIYMYIYICLKVVSRNHK